MSRDYYGSEDAKEIQQMADDAEFLRYKIFEGLPRVIENAQQCISGRGTQDDQDRYQEIQEAQNNIQLCQMLLSKL